MSMEPMSYGSSAPVPAPPAFPQPYKDTTAAWLLWVFLGHLGAHNFYLRRTGLAVTMLVLTLVGWMTVWLLVGFPLLLAVFVMWVVDATQMSGRLQSINAAVYAQNTRLQLAARPW